MEFNKRRNKIFHKSKDTRNAQCAGTKGLSCRRRPQGRAGTVPLSHGHKTVSQKAKRDEGTVPTRPAPNTTSGPPTPRRPAVPAGLPFYGPEQTPASSGLPVAGRVGTVPQSCPCGPGAQGRGQDSGTVPVHPLETVRLEAGRRGVVGLVRPRWRWCYAHTG
jgi:hypothetical protein